MCVTCTDLNRCVYICTNHGESVTGNSQQQSGENNVGTITNSNRKIDNPHT